MMNGKGNKGKGLKTGISYGDKFRYWKKTNGEPMVRSLIVNR